MADGKYKITREVDNKNELDALRKSNAANEKLIATMRQQKTEQRNNEAEAKKLNATIVSGIKTAASAIMGGGGLLAAQRFVTAELRLQQELQQKNAQSQLTLAQAQRALRRNLVGVSESTISDIENRRLPQLARQTGVTQRDLTLSLSGAVSSAGGDVEVAMSATEQAARFAGDAPGAMAELSAGLVNIGKTMGSSDMREALGLMSLIGAETPIKDPRLQAVNIPKGISGVANLGYSTAESGALYSTLAAATGDITGESSGTAAIQLAKQVRGFKGMDQFGSLTEQIGALQADPRLAQKFVDSMSMEAKFTGAVEQLLLNSTGKVAADFADNLSKMTGSNLTGFAEGAISTVGGGRLGPLEAFSRTAGEGIERLLTQDTMTGAAGMARTEIPRALAAGPRDSMIQRFRTARAFDVAGDDPEAVVTTGINILQSEIAGYRRELALSRGEPTALEEKQATALEGILKALETIRDRTAQIPSAGSAQTNREAGMSQ